MTDKPEMSREEIARLDGLFQNGLRFMENEDFTSAVRTFEEIIAGGFQNAVLMTTYGNALKGLKQFEKAVAACQQAVDQEPSELRYWMNLGGAVLNSGDWKKAVNIYQTALGQFPGKSEVHFNLGTAWLEGRELKEAESALQRAVSLDRGSYQAWMNLGAVRKLRGQFSQSRAAYEEAVAIDPEAPEAQWNLSLAELSAGDFTSGWERYEWRRKVPDIPVRDFPMMEWDGRYAPEKTLLIHAEQGLGDTLQFIRLATFAKERVKSVCALVPRPLCPIVRLSELVDFVAGDTSELPTCDMHLPMMSLPRLTGDGFKEAVSEKNYLRACDKRVDAWRAEVEDRTKFRIGICWQGNPGYREDGLRSVPLFAFETLCQESTVELWALQKGSGLEQVGSFGPKSQLVIPGARLDSDFGAFMDTAALTTLVDLVITSDTAVAHLAGGLGVPVWLALPFVADWRWGQSGDTTAWYPTMRLFRQESAGDWTGVFARISHALEKLRAA